MAFEVPPLPYAAEALEPHIDAQTMTIHHDKHHQAYVDKLNAALEGTKHADRSIEDIISDLDSIPEDKRTCPNCGHRGFCELKTRKVFQCNRCKKQLSLTAGTVFQDSKLPLATWFGAIYHLTQSKGGISSIELGRRLGVKQATAWLVKHKLMRTMADREAKKPKLQGRVELCLLYTSPSPRD